jgi:2-oxoglutarate ferredoxin oxidoreductase subunit delta
VVEEFAMGSVDSKADKGTVAIEAELCKGCGLCIAMCPQGLLSRSDELNRRGYRFAEYIGEGCTACGICFHACPEPGGITVTRFR